MAEYINRDELIKGRVANDPVRIAALCEPAADVAPVVRAKWASRMFGTHECSNCHSDPNHYDGVTGYVEFLSDYCPNCGAKMDLEG